MKLNILLILISIFFCKTCFAQELSYLARSPQALLMGDAFTAIADDEYTLFYNPAALGKNKGVAFNLIDPSFGFTNFLKETSRFQNFPTGTGATSAIADRLMDFPVYFQTGIFPTLKMGPFGFSLFANNSTSFLLRNATNPVLDVKYRYDRGFVFAYSHNLIGSGVLFTRAKKSSKKMTSAGQRLSVGFSIKHMNRQGINNDFDLFGTTILSSINSGAKDISALKDALGYSYGTAWGVDTGLEYAISNGPTTITAGLSIMDVGSTRFRKVSGIADVPKQDMMINSGAAFKQDFGLLDYTLSADIRPLNGMVDWSRKFHLGAEVGLPLVTLLAGWSEGYLSYGASIKLWPIKITTGLYSVEAGSKYREQEAQRFILYLSLFDFSIDL